MKKEIDWFGLWYKILKERGDNDSPTFGKLNLITKEVEWNNFSHSDMDGIGALKNYYDSKGFKLKSFPELREKAHPGAIERLAIFYKILFQPKKIETDWKFFDGKKKPNDIHKISWKIFTIEENSLIDDYCKKNHFSKNAFLFNVCSKVLLGELSNNGSGTWTMPVNLRPVLKRVDFNSNHSSGVLIPVNQNDSVGMTQTYLRNALKNKNHWALWWVHQIGKFIGYRGMKYISQKNSQKTYFAGTFSNLGSWELPSEDIWVGSPPGSKNFPIGIMVFVSNGHLSLSLKVHPSVLTDEVSVDSLMEKLTAMITGLVAIK